MNNKIAIGILVKPHTILESTDDFYIKTIGSNITATKNQILRYFIQNTEAEYFVLYSHNSELRTLTYDELTLKVDEYVKAIENTGINYFTGILTPKTTIDYGPVKINIGTGEDQKVILEVFTRAAIKAVGYLDVRFQETLCSQDYAIRLGATKFYPSRAAKTQPWLFDIVHSNNTVAKQTLDTHSSGWYQYKHSALPWEQFGGNIETLKPQLKEIKNGFKI
jgi:hypothetical protein